MRGLLLAFLKIYTIMNYCKTRINKHSLKLENRLGASPRGFESLTLRQKEKVVICRKEITTFLLFIGKKHYIVV